MSAEFVIAFILALPAILLMGMMIYGFLPWANRSWKEAESRAEVLVRSVLSTEEYDSCRRNGYIDVPSPAFPRRVYRVPCGSGTVVVIEQGRCIGRLCVAPTIPIPQRETVVVHKLMIEGNEQDYLRTANHLPC